MVESPLSGIRVVDLTTGLAGPFATRLLAEAGADVVKVEPPGGDPERVARAVGFATWNRGKRSVALDLDDEADRAALGRLLEAGRRPGPRPTASARDRTRSVRPRARWSPP